MSAPKGKVLITYDAPNWAYHKNAKVLKKFLSDDFDITLIYDQDKQAMCDHIVSNDYDMIFFQWYQDIDILLQTKLLYKQVCISQIATTYIFNDIEEHGWDSYKRWPLIVAKNNELFNGINNLRGGRGAALAYHVNDSDIFSYSCKKIKNNDFTVGYVGCSENPRKGFHIIEQACKELNVTLKKLDHGTKIEYEKMPEFYRSVDVTVCASNMEGAPNPMIESGLVGTPIITTRVGQIQEMVIDKENGLFIERDVESLKEAINLLKSDDELYNRLSENIAKTCFEWNSLALRQWREIFSKSVEYFQSIKNG